MLILPSTLHRLPTEVQDAGQFFVDLGSIVLPAADAEQAAGLALDRGGHVGFTLASGFVFLTFAGDYLHVRYPAQLLSSWQTWACLSPARDQVTFLFRYDGLPFRPIPARLRYPCTILHCAWGDRGPRLHPVIVGSMAQPMPVAPLPGVLRRLVRDASQQAA
jgi:hypothetical protein